MKFRDITLDTDNHTYVMGILNITPDSFSDGGKFNATDKAVAHAISMEEEGAAIIDIGAESTRPGFMPVSADEELSRLMPVIKKIKENSEVIISVDTMKGQVAKECLNAGVDIINDVSFMHDKELIKIVAESKAGYCLMHNKAFDFELANRINSVIDEADSEAKDKWKKLFITDMENAVRELQESGIDMTKLMIDPGVGFSKGTKENLLAIDACSKMKSIGYPVLLAASRKSVIGNVLNLDVNSRLEGTLALTAFAVMNGLSFVRVHDVKENVRVIKMLEAVRI